MSVYALVFHSVAPTTRQVAFSKGEVVRHYGEQAVVIGVSRRRGVRLRSMAGGLPWYAEPEECEPLY
jgi:hypothetical protein